MALSEVDRHDHQGRGKKILKMLLEVKKKTLSKTRQMETREMVLYKCGFSFVTVYWERCVTLQD